MRILFFTLCMLGHLSVVSQANFRLEAKSKAKIDKISSETLQTIVWVETRLNKNNEKLLSNDSDISDPYISTIIKAFDNNGLNKKNIITIKSLICIECYENEWQEQNAKKAEIIKLNNSQYLVDNNEILSTIDKINNLDSISARVFADKIGTTSKTGYEFFKLKKREKYQQYIYDYIQIGLSLEELSEQKENGCSKCISVVFNVYNTGENKDLEIEGMQRIRFDHVTGSFLDLFPTWQREFAPNSTYESITKGKDDVIRNGNRRVYQFVKFNGVWEIRNQS